jgi:hypothetical protein
MPNDWRFQKRTQPCPEAQMAAIQGSLPETRHASSDPITVVGQLSPSITYPMLLN